MREGRPRADAPLPWGRAAHARDQVMAAVSYAAA
jgi:hypothetical protein